MIKQKLIIYAYDIPLGTAVSVLNAANIEKLKSKQIDDDPIIASTDKHMVYLETKRRKSVRVDIWRMNND